MPLPKCEHGIDQDKVCSQCFEDADIEDIEDNDQKIEQNKIDVELVELRSKINNLRQFIQTRKYLQEVGEKQRVLLQQQLVQMTAYEMTLVERYVQFSISMIR